MARILAVDDERAILDALARVLGRDGHEVVKAADPTAVPGMDLSRFDLVLCDVMMPGLDGFELVRQIRPDFDGPIIFLTARVAEEDAVAGYGLGADDYVRKPFGAAELRAKVAAHLRRERRPRSHALSFGEVRIVSVNLFFTSFAKQARRSRKGGFTGCANVFSPIPVTA